MTKPISDIEFISKFNPELADTYTAAKNRYIDAPIQTLVELRSLMEKLCDELIDEYQVRCVSNDLHEKVNSLKSSNSFRPELIEIMHSIRKAGNDAAHRNERRISFAEFSELALSRLKQFCTLAEIIWQQRQSTTPAYQFSDKINSPVKEWCYKALFNDDREAKFEVGIALCEKYRDQLNDENSSIISQAPLIKAIDLIQEAAEEFHPEAMFEYGLILLKGLEREVDLEKGKQFLYSSASRGFVKAKASYAELIVNSENSDNYEIEDAYLLAKEAAESGNSKAQYWLSKIYSDPKFNVENQEEAELWFSRAVDSGDPDAQYEHAKALCYKKDASPDEILKALNLLENAIEKGHREAFKFYIGLYKDSQQTQLTKEHYRSYFTRYPDDDEMLVEFVEWLYSKGAEQIEYMEEALHKLARIYRLEKFPTELKAKLQRLSPTWLKEYEIALKTIGGFDEIKHYSLLRNFKVDGTPHENVLDISDDIKLIRKNPELVRRLMYRSIFMASPPTSKTLQGRNEPCNCGSRKKYKKCCGS